LDRTWMELQYSVEQTTKNTPQSWYEQNH
jgi:hypothetical protein